MPIAVFALALVIGGMMELAEHIGWPLAILVAITGLVLLFKAVLKMLAWVEDSSQVPIAPPAPTGQRCVRCGLPATKRSSDRLFLWCDWCAGPDDVPLYGLDPRRYSSAAARYIRPV